MGRPPLQPSSNVLFMANQTKNTPTGVLKDASITIQGAKFTGDFEVLALTEADNFPALLWRPWCYTNNVDLRFNKGYISFESKEERVIIPLTDGKSTPYVEPFSEDDLNRIYVPVIRDPKIIHFVDRVYAWHKLPVLLGLVYLEMRRTLHQRYNLLNVGATPVGEKYNPADYGPFKIADGKYTDPIHPDAGSEGFFFGRNMLPSRYKEELLKPNPMVVATKLLARMQMYENGEQLNMLVASWIQFTIHDWIDHLEDTNQVELTAPQEVAQQCPLKAFKFFDTKEVPTRDADVIYGSKKSTKLIRTFNNGKLRLGKDGLLIHSDDGIPLSRYVRNSWAKLSVFQALFIQEHNAICDMLKWMPNPMVVATKLLARMQMYENGEQLNMLVASWIQFTIHDWIDHLEDTNQVELTAPQEVAQQCPLKAFKFFDTKEVPTRDADVIYGSKKSTKLIRTFNNGKLRLGKDGLLIHSDDGIPLSRYVRNSWAKLSVFQALFIQEHNAICDMLKWEDLTNDKEAIQVLHEVYGNDVESLDLLVGLMAEIKITGYAIGETAFFIFLLMASRRLETDRFFASDFNEEVYTKEGLARVNSTESLKDVLNRHYPEMVEKWMNSSSAFSVWSASPEPVKLIPLYLRFPKLLWF
ncbi:hypothetical protein KI387_008762 [Taxus chinensis]|uniref:Uncharacterized protein n=1 Tax=Taxus chinensis TaxID=29808 RepID=A0AA38FIJ2_TAXCH|nr:hypothetical protein KI387_008762 [Taxus chinensis]